MIVFHGTALIIETPSVKYSRKYLDFGVGFYVTADKKQAELWAKRKSIRLRATQIINAYKISDDLSAYKGLAFLSEDTAWLDFVAKCRKGEDIFKKFDYISGAVANDDVFLTVDMYVRGIWNSERALSELRYYKTSHQICLISQDLIDNELSFYDSYEVN